MKKIFLILTVAVVLISTLAGAILNEIFPLTTSEISYTFILDKSLPIKAAGNLSVC